MKIKSVLYFVLCICVAFLMTSCKKEENETPSPTPSMTPAPTQGTIGNVTITLAPPENMEITIYSIDPDTCEKMAVTVLVSEVTPQLIIDEVVSAMRDGAFMVEVNDVLPEGDTVIVDFKSDAPPVIDVGASVEGVILDAIGQSILDNMPQYSKIIYRIEGGAYVTGHFELGLDEVYIGR